MKSYLLVVLLVASACRSPNGVDDAVDGGVDAPGIGCTAMSPRTIAPETFVGPTGLQPRLTALIDGAQQTLDVHMYLFTVRALADRLVAATQRGVLVRVILDPDHAGNATVRNILTTGNVPVRNATTLYTFSHAKYLVIDGERVVIMSANFNADAMTSERNYGLIDRDPDDVEDAQAVFDMDWAAAGGEPIQPADLACTRLVVSPTNAKARLIALIDSATSTLDLAVMYISETGVLDAIVAAHQRGVSVRVLLSDRQDDAVPVLRNAGITLKFPSGYFLHAKLIIADGVAFVGSENMSFTSLTKNRELGALVFEPSATAPITLQFDTDWAAGAP